MPFRRANRLARYLLVFAPNVCDVQRTAEEVVRCLERAIGAQQDLREALRGWSRGGGDGDAGRGSGPAAWRVLLRELRAAAAGGGGASAAREAGADPSACAETALEGGGGGGGGREGHRGVLAREKEASNAARVLLGELEPLERLEVRVQFSAVQDITETCWTDGSLR